MARFGLRRGKGGDPPAPAQGAEPTAQQAQPTQQGTQPAATGAQQPTQPPTRPATGSHPTAGPVAEPTVAERLEGQRAWLAQLDRRVGVRTYAGAAGLVIALAAAAVALVLVLQLDDEAAKTSDIGRLEEQIADVRSSATEAAQEDVQSVAERITQLEVQVDEAVSAQDSTDQQLSVIEDDIQDLRDEIADIDTSSGGSGNSP